MLCVVCVCAVLCASAFFDMLSQMTRLCLLADSGGGVELSVRGNTKVTNTLDKRMEMSVSKVRLCIKPHTCLRAHTAALLLLA